MGVVCLFHHEYTTASPFFILLLRDMWVVSRLGLLWIVLLWTFLNLSFGTYFFGIAGLGHAYTKAYRFCQAAFHSILSVTFWVVFIHWKSSLWSRAGFCFVLFCILRGHVLDQTKVHEYETKCNSFGDWSHLLGLWSCIQMGPRMDLRAESILCSMREVSLVGKNQQCAQIYKKQHRGILILELRYLAF